MKTVKIEYLDWESHEVINDKFTQVIAKKGIYKDAVDGIYQQGLKLLRITNL